MPDPRFFAHYELQGTHREIGRQHGEALRDLIRRHLDLIYSKGLREATLSRERVLRLAESFVPYLTEYTPHFLEEIAGVAEGAGIGLSEAVLLQVRQEVVHSARFGEQEAECTTFAAAAPYTRDGRTYAGQNADLSGDFEEFSAVLTFAVPGKPRIMMLVPAGQVSYIGMNDQGMSACANFLNCRGWRKGFPRYLLTRIALEERTVEQAAEAVLKPYRASSRNLLLAQRGGKMADIETTPSQYAIIWGKGALAHANHYVLESMAVHEHSEEQGLNNSRLRHGRMEQLLEEGRGRIDVEYLKAVQRDHEHGQDSICAHRPPGKERHTFAAMIAVLDENRMELAKGPPCGYEYRSYRL